MKLYIYEHCPFSARVRYVAGMMNIELDLVKLAYDDAKTTTDLIGAKQVPILINKNGQAMSESLEIIAYFLELGKSDQTAQPSQSVLDWQKSAFLPLQKVGYPRWSQMNLAEFKTESSRQAWRAKKETEALNFDILLKDTKKIASEVESLIEDATEVLNLDYSKNMSFVDEAIVFSILRAFFSAKEIRWNKKVKDWMELVSHQTQVSLLK